jgi:hypothetical protein
VAQLAQWKLDAIERARNALASGGRSTTEGLFAAQLDLQREVLAHQREAQEAQLRERRQATFRDAYSPFLETAKVYSRAIDDYWKWMYTTQYRADRNMRGRMQASVREAREELDRALQPILLIDSDETRGSLRWELLRRRGLEPIIDTIENQRAYAEVIHYENLRLLHGINLLQENVREALGHPPRSHSDADRDFTEWMFADAKAKADAAEADIKAQYERLMKENLEDPNTDC